MAIDQAGLLAGVLTVLYCRPGSMEDVVSRLVRLIKPDVGRRLRGRYRAGLAPGRISSSGWLGLGYELGRRGRSRQRWLDREARWTVRTARRLDWGGASLLHGFIRHMSPALIDAAHDAGLAVTGDQIIAPAAVEIAEMETQQERWPGWEPPEALTSLYKRGVPVEQQTLPKLDRIICMSDYVRDGLASQGVADDRIDVVPYPFDASGFAIADRSGREQRPVIGFVGKLGLRKGLPYFVEVAKRLAGRAKFVAIGPMSLTDRAVQEASRWVELHGPVPRSEVVSWLERFDLMYFPTTCEGSAGAVMEAMATGLPVVTSPNSGTVARDGVDGRVLPYDDVGAAVEAIGDLIDSPQRRAEWGSHAAERARQFGLDVYAPRLIAALRTAVLERGR